jgi:solute carrier family 25 carnitine/acylcarnitine transporter 20/29
LAGSVAGAIGVGVAFPLDTLKTKAQVLGPETNGMVQTVKLIWNTEGMAGFFGTLFF